MDGSRYRKEIFFNSAWYLSKYPDVAASGLDPWFHYCRFGKSEGRLPYSDTVPALEHWLWRGAHEVILPHLKNLLQNRDTQTAVCSHFHHHPRRSAKARLYPRQIISARWALARWHAHQKNWQIVLETLCPDGDLIKSDFVGIPLLALEAVTHLAVTHPLESKLSPSLSTPSTPSITSTSLPTVLIDQILVALQTSFPEHLDTALAFANAVFLFERLKQEQPDSDLSSQINRLQELVGVKSSATTKRSGLQLPASDHGDTHNVDNDQFLDIEELRLKLINSVFANAGLAVVTKRLSDQHLTIDNLTRVSFDEAVPGSWSEASRSDLRPLVSVIIPMHNAGQGIKTALLSLFEQTWRPLEIIVVDDSSTDNSAAVVSELRAQLRDQSHAQLHNQVHSQLDTQVRSQSRSQLRDQSHDQFCVQLQVHCPEDVSLYLIRSDSNRGAYAARNLGLAYASGEFVTVHDSDDWSHPQKLEKQVLCLLENPSLMGCFSHWVRASQDLVFTHWRIEPEGWTYRNMSSLMCRRSAFDALGSWDEVRVNGDTEFHERLVKIFGHDSVADVLPGVPLSFGRMAPNSLSQNPETHLITQYRGVRHDYMASARRWHEAMVKGSDDKGSLSENKTSSAPTADTVVIEPFGAVNKALCRALYLPPNQGYRPFPAPPAICAKQLPVKFEHPLDEIQDSGLFDEGWYVTNYIDLQTEIVDPLTHYWEVGALEGRDPGPNFSTTGYLALHPEISPSQVASNGVRRGAGSSAAGNSAESSAQNNARNNAENSAADISANRDPQNPLLHFIRQLKSRYGKSGEGIADDGSGFASRSLHTSRHVGLGEVDGVGGVGDVGGAADRLDNGLESELGTKPGIDSGTEPGIDSGADSENKSKQLSGLSFSHPLQKLGSEWVSLALPTFVGKRRRKVKQSTVMVVAHAAGETLYGAERSLIDVVKAIDELGLNTVVVLPSAANHQYIETLRTHTLAVSVMPYGWWQTGKVAEPATVDHFERLMKAYEVDLVHVNTLVLDEPLVAARALGIPSVVHVRELPEHDVRLCQDLNASAVQLRQRVLDTADGIVANSMQVLSWLRDADTAEGSVTEDVSLSASLPAWSPNPLSVSSAAQKPEHLQTKGGEFSGADDTVNRSAESAELGRLDQSAQLEQSGQLGQLGQPDPSDPANWLDDMGFVGEGEVGQSIQGPGDTPARGGEHNRGLNDGRGWVGEGSDGEIGGELCSSGDESGWGRGDGDAHGDLASETTNDVAALPGGQAFDGGLEAAVDGEPSDLPVDVCEVAGRPVFRVTNTVDMTSLLRLPVLDVYGSSRSSDDYLRQEAASNELVVGMLSSNLPKKGLDDVVEVARHLSKASLKGLRFRFVLFGPETKALEAVLDSQPSAGDVRICSGGYVADPAQALAEIDVVINLSRFQESFGRTVLEAMAAARPVVGYAWGALPELVVNSQTGFLVPFGDTEAVADRLLQLHQTPKLRLYMGLAGRERAVGYFSGERLKEQLVRVYGRFGLVAEF